MPRGPRAHLEAASELDHPQLGNGTVVREALTRLAEQGLAVATPQRGFRVRELSVDDIAGLTESRVQIESTALRLAIERGDVQWRRRSWRLITSWSGP